MALDRMIGFALTARPDEARAFYADKLGFRFIKDDGFALVFDAHGTMLRIAKMKDFAPAKHTILGWEVADIAAEIRALVARGVAFEQLGLSFMAQDELGIWTAPSGDKVAWFKDPDGNTLSLSQHTTA